MCGVFVKKMRLKANLTLREFCGQLGEDASNWSKVERELFPPPKDTAKLERIARVLGIDETSPEWNHLFDYASVDGGNIPRYILSDEEVLKTLPVFFRTIGSVKPSQKELVELINTITGKNPE